MVEQESRILKEFSEYIKGKWAIELNENNTYNKVKNAFDKISNDNLPIIRLDEKIQKKKQDFEDISKPYVRGESYGSIGGGAPIDSYKESYDENIHILRMELETEISNMVVDKRIMEKQLKEEFTLFEKVCSLLTNQVQQQVLIMTYLEKRRYAETAIILNYSYNTVKQYVSNGIREISKKVKQYTKIYN